MLRFPAFAGKTVNNMGDGEQYGIELSLRTQVGFDDFLAVEDRFHIAGSQ